MRRPRPAPPRGRRPAGWRRFPPVLLPPGDPGDFPRPEGSVGLSASHPPFHPDRPVQTILSPRFTERPANAQRNEGAKSLCLGKVTDPKWDPPRAASTARACGKVRGLVGRPESLRPALPRPRVLWASLRVWVWSALPAAPRNPGLARRGAEAVGGSARTGSGVRGGKGSEFISWYGRKTHDTCQRG